MRKGLRKDEVKQINELLAKGKSYDYIKDIFCQFVIESAIDEIIDGHKAAVESEKREAEERQAKMQEEIRKAIAADPSAITIDPNHPETETPETETPAPKKKTSRKKSASK